MTVEGLQAILNKEEIVATQRAEDLQERPEIVDRVYQQHLRTYVPLGRQAQGDSRGQSVTEFERNVINEVKQAGAVRGYITAEYGHGKTSTALYLWQRARDENILAVPPFQLNRLSDLLRATYGWLHYEVQRTRPQSDALAPVQELYQQLMDRSAEALSRRYNMSLADAQRMARERPDILDIRPADYIRFFDTATVAAQEAGYFGLLVIADELQQYIDPEIKSGIKDPVSPLFDVIGAVLTRRGQLNFGLILVIPPRELGTLRSERGDLIHRLLQASLDLRTVYDQDFPRRLWQRLAKAGSFAEHAGRIISDEALAALGQIAARTDLSDGPRTVVNTLRRASRRYIECGYPGDDPYTPYHLVDDLLKGNIQYDSSKKIAQVTARVLGHSLVKGHPQREKAVMWAAAFPNEGIPLKLQEKLGLAEEFEELARSAHGDLVISVGDVRQGGMTLRGLEEAPVETDWLSSRVRDFWRDYYETSDRARQRAMDGLKKLLVTKVFPANQWSVVEEIPDRLTQNAGIVFRGSYVSQARRFPERTVHVRLLWEEEDVRDEPQGEVVVQIRLHRYLDVPESSRKELSTPINIDFENRTISLDLNLSRRDEAISPNLERAIGPIVTPYKLTPLLLLNLYQVLDEDRAKNRIPQQVDQVIRHGIQPDLLGDAFRELFNDGVGMPVGAAEERIVELALAQIFAALYPEYDTLILAGNWQNSLQKYSNALSKLETSHERQGQVVVEGLKDEISAYFTLSNTGYDSFVRNYPALIEQVEAFSSQNPGKVRFTLHPLEQKLKVWLREAAESEYLKVGGERYEVRYLPINVVYRRAASLGYLDKEVEAILELMVTRGLIDLETGRGIIRETITQAPSVDELEADVEAWQNDLESLAKAFAPSSSLKGWQEDAKRARELVAQLRARPDDARLIMARRSVQKYQQLLVNWAAEQHQQLRREMASLLAQVPVLADQQTRQLQRTVTGSVDYAPQVNDLRNRLLKIQTHLGSDIDQLRQNMHGTRAALDVHTLTFAALCRFAEELHKYRPQLQALRERRQDFQTQFEYYAGWVELVEKGTQLSEQIQQHGDLVQQQDKAFQELSRNIRGHLSANKLDALPDSPTYSMNLNELAQEVHELKTQASQAFLELQDRYRSVLTRQLGFPPGHLWEPYQYNPVAPRETRERLWDEVRRALEQRMVPRLQQVVDDQQEGIRTPLNSPLLRMLPASEQEDLSEKGRALSEELQKLSKDLESVHAMLQDSTAISDFPEEHEGAFHHLIDELSKIRNGVSRLQPEVDALSTKLRNLELTRTEEQVLQALPESQAELELSDLRQKVAGRVGNEDFLTALDGLHAKRRIRVLIAPVRHD